VAFGRAVTTDSLKQPGGWSVSTEPNWSQWAYTLATVMERLTHHATGEDREAAWRAIADFDRQARAWRRQPAGAASHDW
jgi:hypothetical protein